MTQAEHVPARPIPIFLLASSMVQMALPIFQIATRISLQKDN